MVMMVMVMAAAGAVFIMLMVMLVMMLMLLVVVIMTAAAVLVLVMMVVMMLVLLVVMVVTAAAVLILVMMVVMVLMLLVVVIMTAAAMLVLVMMMVMMLVLFFLFVQALQLHLCQLSCQGSLALHGCDQLLAGQFAPGRGDQGSNLVMLPDQSNTGIQLCLGNGIGTGQDNGGSGLDLVVVELAKVLHIDLDLTGIGHSHGVAQGHFVTRHLFYSGNDVGQLAHAGWLDDDAVGMILCDHLGQSLTEIAHQAAADTAGVHLGDVDAGILQETAVDADFTEFVLNQDEFLALVGFADHLFDEGSLACTQEAGVNIDFSHKMHLLYKIFQLILYH